MRDQLNAQPAVAQALATALPAEQRPHAAALASFLGDLAAGLAPTDAVRRMAEQPVLAAALAALAGQHLDIAGRPLHITGNVGTLQQITISGGYVDRIVGAQVTIALPPTPRIIDPAAAQALLEALPLDRIPPVAPLPELQRMPFSRNPLFVGREADLRAIATTLKGEGSTAAIGQVAAATGLGGIGKTNLATEFAHRYGQFFAGGIFWLSFADPAGVPAEVAACGAALDIPGFADLKLDEQVQRVQAAWQQPIPRLLVFDNCDETVPGQAEALIQQWKPSSGGCRVLITSRKASWSRSLGIAALPLSVLSRAESIALLRKHRPDLAENDPALNAIAAELGDLPLALHLAGSFLETYRDSPTFGDPADFLAELRNQRLLEHDALKGIDVTPSPTNHELHVARTFALSYERLDPADSVDTLAIRLLARAACLAPSQPIPRELLLATLEIAEDDRSALRQAERGLLRLVGLGLMEVAGDGALRLHRLLHAFVGDIVTDPEAQGAVEQTLLQAMDERKDATYWLAPLSDILVHLQWAVERAMKLQEKKGVVLANNVAGYLHQIGNYVTAQPLLEWVLAISEATFGSTHIDTAQSLNNLAELLRAKGDYATAQPLHERALMIREAIRGPTHIDTAQSLNNLAELLRAKGDYATAQRLYERALEICKTTLGLTHTHTLTCLNNLALLHYDQGNYVAAYPLLAQALRIFETTFGSSHPAVAPRLHNLAGLLKSVGDYVKARPLYERALAICEATRGPTHPDTAQSLNGLGGVHYAVGNYEVAQSLYKRALMIHEATYGPNHPDVAQSLNNLAASHDAMGDYKAAQLLYKRALEICKVNFGFDHPYTASNLHNLAVNQYPLQNRWSQPAG